MPAYEPWVKGGIYGTGEEQNWWDGVPQPASFQGMTPWWTVPTNWYMRSVDGQIFVSPTWNFAQWVFAAKIDQDGALKIQMPYGIRQNGIQAIRVDQFTITYPPDQIFAQAIFFTGNLPNVTPANKSMAALAYNEQSFLYGWNTSLFYWIPLITEDGNIFSPTASSPLAAGSDQIMLITIDNAPFPNDQTLVALAYDVHSNLYGWHTSYNYWIPIISSTVDGVILQAISNIENPEGQIAFGDGAAVTPVDTTEPQLFYNPESDLFGWDNVNHVQIPLIS